MKKINIFSLSLIFIMLITVESFTLEGYKKYYYNLLRNYNIIMKHVTPNKQIEAKGYVNKGESLGDIQNMPKIMSLKYNNEIIKSMEFYNNKDFNNASKTLEEPYKKEPKNPFILNTYARALYWVDREKSFDIYKKLINILDSEYDNKADSIIINKDDNLILKIDNINIMLESIDLWNKFDEIKKDKVIIDIWFLESYWKLGTLYLDMGDYFNGVYEITRGLIGGLEDYENIREQALSYLTESFYFLKKYNFAFYCGNEVLNQNKNNQYVLKYINKLKKDSPDYYKLFSNNEALIIFNELHDLVKKNSMEDKNITEAVYYIKKMIDNNKIILLINERFNNTVLSSASFQCSKDLKNNDLPYIFLNRNLIDIYKKQKSIVFSILIHEIKHAYDFFNNKNFYTINIGKNELEQYLFEMDAAYFEALFIDKFLNKNNYKLTNFENCLMQSNNKDNLISYSFFIKGIDMALVYDFSRMRYDKKLKSENMKTIIETGKYLINNSNLNNKNDEKKFILYSSLFSYYKFIPQIVYEIEVNKGSKNINPEDFNLKDFSFDIYTILKKIEDIITPHTKFYHDYLNKTLNNLDRL